MKKQAPPPQSSGNEGYGGYGNYGNYGYGAYSGYYYGYGYGSGGGYQGGGEPAPARTFRDYLLILRERIWYVIVTFFVIFVACVLYALNKTPEYYTQATVQVFREPDTHVTVTDPNNRVVTPEDFTTRLQLMQSPQVAADVANRLTNAEMKKLMAPYENGYSFMQQTNPQQILMNKRTVTPVRMSLIINVGFQHPDKEIAATVANLFADAFITRALNETASNTAKAVESLSVRAAEQSKNVEAIQAKMSEMVKKYGLVSLKKENNIDASAMQQQTGIVTENKRILDAAEIRWKQVQDQQAAKKPLWDLSSIGGQSRVSELLKERTSFTTQLANLGQKYGPKHPDIIALTQQLSQLDDELGSAVESATQTVFTDYQSAQRNYDQSLAQKQQLIDENIALSGVQTSYDRLQQELDVAQSMYKELQSTVEHEQAKYEMEAPNYRVVDKAPVNPRAVVPNIPFDVMVGLVGGLVCGLGIAFLVAFLDDRIKTAFDIESVVGLPLLGIVPRIRHLNITEKAQAVATNTDRRATESFRSIYSSLKLNDAAKNARAILVTSTVPSEGKSFVTTNLGITYAMHGERVLVVDCDLRMPNVGKSMGMEKQEKGLLTHLVEGRPLEECMNKDVFPNLDILTTGGKARNPTQIFNSREFADFLAKMRQQYDRIFIDSPPVGAVSDALNLLPAVDGVLYVIKFNSVKRKTAKLNLRRLLEGNVPIFGAILNQISLSVASYYYTSYYDKSYRNYYVHDDDEDDQPKDRAATSEPQGTGKS